MKLSSLTNKSIKARHLIDVADVNFAQAKDNLDLISWISPAGDMYIEPRSVIETIIAEGSWR